jgi:hypothetical protein
VIKQMRPLRGNVHGRTSIDQLIKRRPEGPVSGRKPTFNCQP